VNRARPPEAEVDGVPTLQLHDDGREAIAELIAAALIVALEAESSPS
jgi:hypothetical protein